MPTPPKPVRRAANALKKYLNSLSSVKLARFARRAKTTPESLRVVSGAYRTGGRPDLSPAFAGRVADASEGALTRAQLSLTCAKCPHTKGEKK